MVSVDDDEGILRLPQGNLFQSSEFELTKEGTEKLNKLALALHRIKSYTNTDIQEDNNRIDHPCQNQQYKIEAIFLEGHADRRPLTSKPYDNDELSTKRALAAFNIINKDLVLKGLKNSNNQDLFSVSGYGARRLLCLENLEACHDENRRIDLRFIMETPDLVQFD